VYLDGKMSKVVSNGKTKDVPKGWISALMGVTLPKIGESINSTFGAETEGFLADW
jgi:hypothetical protein